MAARHTFSATELAQYFDRVALPESKRIFDISSHSDNDKLEYLKLVQKHQLVKIPWENFTQHYSWHRVVHVQPRHLFNKIVNSPGRGGYCMEVNYFFHLILHSLGFDVYMAGSRIYKPPKAAFGGMTHVVNIVTIAGVKYLLDGGYGGPGPTKPLPLVHEGVLEHIAPAEMRLIYDTIPQNLSSQKLWIYQHRPSKDAPTWKTHYCFVNVEFIPADIESMNFEPWLNPRTFFTHKVVANRFSTTAESLDAPGSPGEAALEREIDGAITLDHDLLNWRRNGERVVEIRFQNEDERLEAIKKYFGVTFSDEDAQTIASTAAAIGSGPVGLSSTSARDGNGNGATSSSLHAVDKRMDDRKDANPE